MGSQTICPECKGTGRPRTWTIGRSRCGVCYGTGAVSSTRPVSLPPPSKKRPVNNNVICPYCDQVIRMNAEKI